MASRIIVKEPGVLRREEEGTEKSTSAVNTLSWGLDFPLMEAGRDGAL